MSMDALSPNGENEMAEQKNNKKNDPKIKEMRDKEFKKRQSREKDIKRERSEGFEKKIAGD
jgi:hypothetical protein